MRNYKDTFLVVREGIVIFKKMLIGKQECMWSFARASCKREENILILLQKIDRRGSEGSPRRRLASACVKI